MRMTKKKRKQKKKLQMRNKKLIKKYYFLAPKNVWTGKISKDYDYTWINWGCSPGWEKAYGNMYMKELGDEIKRIGQKDFMILQEKEKFATHRLYTNGTSEKAYEIIDKYEFISEHVCYFCGRPDTHVTDTGWILPVCPKCYEKKWRRGSKFEYDEIVCDEDSRIPDVRQVCKYSSQTGESKTIEYNIKDTVDKIRIWWNKNHPDDQVEVR